MIKTARFAAVVEAAGKPDTQHLLLVSPERDKALQAAIRTHRVMTVHQELVGNKADHGAVDFEPGRARQFLIFPKSISKFKGIRIVGIKYDLLEAGRPPKERAKSVKEPKKAGSKSTFPEEKSKPQAPAHEKVVHFTKPELQEEPDGESEAIEGIKKEARRAMELGTGQTGCSVQSHGDKAAPAPSKKKRPSNVVDLVAVLQESIQQSQGKAKADKPVRKAPATSRKAPRKKKAA